MPALARNGCKAPPFAVDLGVRWNAGKVCYVRTAVILSWVGGIAAAAGVLVACGTPDRAYSGHDLYQSYCARCHGSDGTGGARPGAPDLTGLAARRDGGFPMALVLARLEGYGRGVSAISESEMPRYGLLLDGPLMHVETAEGRTPKVPAKLVAIANHLRELQRP